MASNLNINGNFVPSTGGNTLSVDKTVPVPSPICSVTAIALASGFNSIAVPTGATQVMIQLPVGNATSVTLKGPTGDTGIALAPGGSVTLLPIASSVTTIGLTAGGAIAALTFITFL